ncbi:MAG: hypothetical protein H8E14_10330 [Candidatus Marinimicrobia bacterium]|nr:hypothetical protein [Candidatus Neomarinimicrobiota bacterium]
MNSRQRTNLALHGKKPDRVPVWCLLSLEHIIKNGTTDGLIPESIEEFIEVECRLTQSYNFDGMLVYFPNVRAGTEIGSTIRMMTETLPQGRQSDEFKDADPNNWEFPNQEFVEADFYSSHLARDIIGPDIHVGGWIGDGFSRAIQWFPSLEDAMIATIEDPVRFKSLVNYFDAISVASAKAQIALGKLESIQISSPYAGASFISLDAYRELVFSSVSKLAHAIRDAGGIAYLHTCGYIADRLEVFADTGVNGIECMDPPPLGNVTLADAKQKIGSRISLKGNIDSVNVLLLGNDEGVDHIVSETLRVGKPGGGYVLSTACSVAQDVKPERIKRLYTLAEEYGYY